MSLNKLFIIFGIILVIFVGIVFSQLKPISKTPKSTVKINNRTFNVEVANTPKTQQLGLSGRDKLAQNQGMLFMFDAMGYHTFWMKNMKFPIDIIFIKDNTIVTIEKNALPAKSGEANLPLYKPNAPINKVLEINGGLSDKYRIKTGDKVEINLK